MRPYTYLFYKEDQRKSHNQDDLQELLGKLCPETLYKRVHYLLNVGHSWFQVIMEMILEFETDDGSGK